MNKRDKAQARAIIAKIESNVTEMYGKFELGNTRWVLNVRAIIHHQNRIRQIEAGEWGHINKFRRNELLKQSKRLLSCDIHSLA